MTCKDQQALVEFLHAPLEKARRVSLSGPQVSSPHSGAVGMPFGSADASSLKSPIISAPKSLSDADGSMKVSPPGIGGGTAQVPRFFYFACLHVMSLDCHVKGHELSLSPSPLT